jgi:hypothetical protein
MSGRTTGDWRKPLRHDPIPPLLSCGNPAIEYFAKRDLLNQRVESVKDLWSLEIAERILGKQQPDGSWKYKNGNYRIRSPQNYDQLETYRVLRVLVEKYGLVREHPAIEKAAEFLFGFQTSDGDLRGIYGNQYSPNYTAGIMELLIKAGYIEDPQIEKGFGWLLSIRQKDGGWAIPLRTINANLSTMTMKSRTIEPERSKPSSWLVTGVVLRAFTAHPGYRKSREATAAGKILKSRLFKRDSYPDRGTVEYWTRFTFPFWFTDLLSALDSLSKLGLGSGDSDIAVGLEWFFKAQQPTGQWKLKILNSGGDRDTHLWIDLAICRLIKRFDA